MSSVQLVTCGPISAKEAGKPINAESITAAPTVPSAADVQCVGGSGHSPGHMPSDPQLTCRIVVLLLGYGMQAINMMPAGQHGWVIHPADDQH